MTSAAALALVFAVTYVLFVLLMWLCDCGWMSPVYAAGLMVLACAIGSLEVVVGRWFRGQS